MENVNANSTNVILKEDNLSDTPPKEDPTDIFYNKTITLTPGTYYMKVIAKEENNASNYQIAFDTEPDPENYDIKHYGVLSFDVK